jgi:hypothetical protein
LKARIRDGERPDIPSNVRPQLARLIKECWHQLPEQRPSFEKIVGRFTADEFLDGIPGFDKPAFRDYQHRTCPGFAVTPESQPRRTSSTGEIESVFARAEAGNYAAQFLLGEMIQNDVGSPDDRTSPIAAFKRGAEADKAGCCYLLGQCHEFGLGVPRDPVAAARHFEDGSHLGSPLCRARLAVLNLFGRGDDLPANPDMAAALLASIPPDIQLFELTVTADFVPGLPPSGRYLAAESGLTFARTVCQNFGLEFGTDYSLSFARTGGSSRLLSVWDTLCDQGIVDGQRFELHRRPGPEDALGDAVGIEALTLDRSSFDLSDGIPFEAFAVFPGTHRETGHEVFLHEMREYREPVLFRWLAVLLSVQHPLLLRFVGYCLPTGATPGGIVTASTARAPTDDPRAFTTLAHVLDSSWNFDQRYTALLVIAKCMQYLHSRRVSHRALSVNTILVDAAGCLKIIGFDRAKLDVAVAEPVEQTGPPDPFRKHSALDVVAFGQILHLLVRHFLGPPRTRQNRDSWAKLRGSCEFAEDADPPYTFDWIVETLEGHDFRSQVDTAFVDQRVQSMMRSSEWADLAAPAPPPEPDVPEVPEMPAAVAPSPPMDFLASLKGA